MLDAEFEVCTECGTPHMEGGAGPRDVAECAVCGGRVSDVELDDIIGLQVSTGVRPSRWRVRDGGPVSHYK